MCTKNRPLKRGSKKKRLRSFFKSPLGGLGVKKTCDVTLVIIAITLGLSQKNTPNSYLLLNLNK
jgi:hypothetical protein